MAKEHKRGIHGNEGGFHAGMERHNPPESDPSRAPIGTKHPTVDEGANRSEVGQVNPPTLGPRTA